MNDLEKWRALANFRPSIERSPWEGNMCAYLADAANRVEALERENAALREALNKISSGHFSGMGAEVCAERALAALAPATSKEAP